MGVSRCGTYLFATYKKIRCAIYSGQLSAGEKIPSVREMVKKREDTAKVLCFSYFDNMFALGFSKDEAIRFIQDYSTLAYRFVSRNNVIFVFCNDRPSFIKPKIDI